MSDCKTKWTSLRNSYNRAVRERRDAPSGSAGHKKRKWYLMDAMEFLKDFVGVHRKMASSTDTAEPDVSDADAIGETIESQSDVGLLENVSTPLSDNIAIPSRKSTPATKLMQPMMEFLQSRTKRPGPENPNLTFFKSLIHDIDKLTESRKRKFKQTVINELYRHLDEQENFAYFNTAHEMQNPSSVYSSGSSEAVPAEPQQFAYDADVI